MWLIKFSAHQKSLWLTDTQITKYQSYISVLEERAGQYEDQLVTLKLILFPAVVRRFGILRLRGWHSAPCLRIECILWHKEQSHCPSSDSCITSGRICEVSTTCSRLVYTHCSASNCFTGSEHSCEVFACHSADSSRSAHLAEIAHRCRIFATIERISCKAFQSAMVRQLRRFRL